MSHETVLITGGAGFIGANLADRLATLGHPVIVLDNLSRKGVDQNALWLKQNHGGRIRIHVGDMRDSEGVRKALAGVAHVFHLAAQTAVTSSFVDPRSDFETNVTGTIHLLEAMRSLAKPPSLIYTSTNKVYGPLEDVVLCAGETRYVPVEAEIARRGINETRRLDLRTPYGCSKGAAEQYVLDYGRTFGLATVVFRMSCIYGPHQFGTEDQGWVAHFLARSLERKPITIYGDGLQVRDILFVDDLVDALLLAWSKIGSLSGEAFNIGGGAAHTVSLLELIRMIEGLHGIEPKLYFAGGRNGDQRYYASDFTKFREATGWTPRVAPRHGLRLLQNWLLDARRIAPEEMAAS